MLWQLKKLSTGEALNEAQSLPENWGSIFGMAGIKDRLGDLSWLGEAYADQGWVEVSEPSKITMSVEVANATVEQMLKNTAWAVASDNTSLTKEQFAQWMEYRRALREVHLQVGFPTNIVWPAEPA
jgi:hypothetical protein